MRRPESAFPHPQLADYPREEKDAAVGLIFASPGMSLRDWFAGQALPAILLGNIEAAKLALTPNAKDIPRAAYEYADMMLAEREKK